MRHEQRNRIGIRSAITAPDMIIYRTKECNPLFNLHMSGKMPRYISTLNAPCVTCWDSGTWGSCMSPTLDAKEVRVRFTRLSTGWSRPWGPSFAAPESVTFEHNRLWNYLPHLIYHPGYLVLLTVYRGSPSFRNNWPSNFNSKLNFHTTSQLNS